MVGDSPDIVEERSISDLGDLEEWWDNHAIVAWSFVLFGCVVLNVILLLAFLIRPSLRTISNRFVMNLTVSNLLVCSTMSILLITDAASTKQVSGPTHIGSVCTISEGVVAIVTTSSVLSVLLIAVDQYFAVVDPLHYRARVDKLKAGILIMSIWLISIIFGFLAFFNPNPQSLWLSCGRRNTVSSMEHGTDRLNVSETESFGFLNNSEILDIDDTVITYGFIYAIAYSVFVYFVPFVAVCWIYVSIYVAAHRNSERTRKSGSRPILSSASFTEEQNGPASRLQRPQMDTIEDFRKLPKISSLSSIDETSETIPPGQLSRRRSFSSSLEIEMATAPIDDKPLSGIVFTLGLQPLQVSPRTSSTEINRISASNENNREIDRIARNFVIEDESSDSENEVPFEGFNSMARSIQSSERFPLEAVEGIGQTNVINSNEERGSSSEIQDSGISRNDSRQTRRTSTTFLDNSTLPGTNNKTERDVTVASSPSESSTCLLTPIVTITPATNKNESLQRVSSIRSTSSYINSIKDRLSNGSIFRHREETRAARISAVVIVMGLICWSPYVILLLIKNLPRSMDQHLSHKYDVLASSLFILATYISPLLFGYRSKRVKRELRRFFCFRKELSYKNNRSLMAKKVLKRRHSSTLSHFEMDHKYNIFNCVYGRNRWPKEKVQFVQVPDTALAVETCRSSFSSGASTQISSTSTEEC